MAGNRRGHDPVADIFISYSKKDDPDARLLSVFLELKVLGLVACRPWKVATNIERL
jgi:hypothetical protein